MAYSKEIRQKVYEKYDGHCAYCGRKIAYKDMQIDHIQPIYRGLEDCYLEQCALVRGKDDLSNFNPSCRSCNHRKSTFTIEQYREQLENQFKLTLKDSRVNQCINYGLLTAHPHPIKFYFEILNEINKV